jgi:hypothetical protein
MLMIGAPAAAVVFGRLRYKAGKWSCPAPLGWIALGAVVAFGVARNIPCHPFDFLAPHRCQARSGQAADNEPSNSPQQLAGSR